MNFIGPALSAAFPAEDLILASAVRHLRRCFPNVFRCDIVVTNFGGDDKKTTVTWGDGKGLPGGGVGLHYVETVGIVPNAELPELARQNGWTTK